jgi:deoxyribonuclease-4
VNHLVLHPGCHVDEKAGIRLIAQALDEVHRRVGRLRARVCLESTAGQGNSIGWRFEHLAEILEQATHGDRLGICLDTCHLFAAGHDLRTLRSYNKVIKDFERLVGVDRVCCIHLNDCKKALGCRVDRHEEIGKGTLGLTAFRCFVNDDRFDQTIAVLETPYPERYRESIALLRSLSERPS